MRDSSDLIKDSTRQWWWSPVPFWLYFEGSAYGTFYPDRGRGWANLVDTHPGLFNLAWMMSGATLPPNGDLTKFAPNLLWVHAEAKYIPMAQKTMADWAFWLSLPEFRKKLREDKDGPVRHWKFHDAHITYNFILKQLDKRCSERA